MQKVSRANALISSEKDAASAKSHPLFGSVRLGGPKNVKIEVSLSNQSVSHLNEYGGISVSI